jgi:hypothetical protein
MSFNVDGATLVAAAAAVGISVWRWMSEPGNGHLVSYLNNTQKQVDKLQARVDKLKEQAKKTGPSAGPYRTAAAGEPNTEGGLPQPTPPEVQKIQPWGASLACPICNCNNRETRKGEMAKGQTACNGCIADPAPHLHITCWNCGFRYAVKPFSSTKVIEEFTADV